MNLPSHPATSAPPGAKDASDERLLAGVVWGEPGAEGAFVRRFSSRVYGLATAIVGEGPRSEDVAVEALVQACRHARTYESTRGPVITWVLGITRRLALETRTRHPPEAVDVTAAKRSARSEICLLDLDPGPTRQASANVAGRIAAVRGALSRLPVEQRRAVLLAALYGYTARDISEAEVIPLDAAQARLRSGLTKMSAISRQHGPLRPGRTARAEGSARTGRGAP